MSLPRDIEERITTAIAAGEIDGDRAVSKVHSIFDSLPGVSPCNNSSYRIKEYEFSTRNFFSLPTHLEGIGGTDGLGLSIAPSIEKTIPLPRGSAVLIIRYNACEGEDLLPFEKAAELASPAARERAIGELRKLAEHGLVHPFSRGPMHWWVSSKTGTLVLDSWYCVRNAEPEEAQYLLGRAERVLAKYPRRGPGWGVPTSDEAAQDDAPADKIRQTFGTARVFLPVIHPVEWGAALTAIDIAVTARAPGVFLINQGMGAEAVLDLVLEVRRRHPKLWVGVNLLGYAPAQALETALSACEGRLDGLWTDNAGIDESLPPEAQASGRAFAAARERLGWRGLYFGGVAFKYQREVAAQALPAAARAAAPYLDVLCTSGPGTGREANPAKLAALSGPLPLALASGVTVENVSAYLPYVSAFLVGTGIEHSLGVLDPVRVQALATAIASYK